MNFLPQDYQPPASNGDNYTKLQPGTNVLRILSKPLLGWEVWINERPIRSTLSDKPESDGEGKPREFWAMIVWNYEVEKIQIWYVTQGSIKKSIRDLALDQDWGNPVGYDIKITKSGQQLKTSYSLTPSPKSELSQEIKSNFFDCNVYLPALISGEDPFIDHGKRTLALWEETSNSTSISSAQYNEIMGYIGDDSDYLKKVTDGVKNTYHVNSLKEMPLEHFDKVLRQVKLHSEERIKKEMGDELPF